MATYSIGKIKTFLGCEGHGLNAVILKDGKPICFVRDDANGGEVDFDFSNPCQSAKSYEASKATWQAEKTAFLIFVRDWFVSSGGFDRWVARMKELEIPHGAEPDNQEMMEEWVNTLVDEHSTRQRFNRLAKKATLFRIAGEPVDSWRTVKAPYSEGVEKFLTQKYGDKVVAVWGVRGDQRLLSA